MGAKISFSKKLKCQGCQALKKKDKKYCCLLGVAVQFDVNDVDKEPIHPVPMEKCFKPLSPNQLKEAQELVAK